MSKEIISYNFSDPNICIYNLEISNSPQRHYRGEHFHKEAEILLVLEGEILLRTYNTEMMLRSGQSAFIGRNIIHTILPTSQKANILILQAPLSEIEENVEAPSLDVSLTQYILENQPANFRAFPEEGNAFSDILYKINEELNGKSSYYEAYIKAYIHLLTAFLKRSGLIHKPIAGKNGQSFEKLNRISEYITENHDQKISLADLEIEIKYNKFYICKLFKTNLNTTFTEYLNYVRCKHAERLLFSTEKKISEIATEVGFSSTQSFIKVFKAFYNHTPLKYKSIYHSNDGTGGPAGLI